LALSTDVSLAARRWGFTDECLSEA
jgi:hypothetical protein